MSTPDISIILPVYNVERYLDRCMRSILGQTIFGDEADPASGDGNCGKVTAEIILVDDGSTDDSGRLCDEYERQYRIVKVIHTDNAGASAARNAGLKDAEGRWVSFIDPDDYVEPDLYEQAYRRAARTQADIVFFDSFREYGSGRTRGCRHFDRDFTTVDPDRLTEVQCRTIFRMPVPWRPDHFLGGPWDKLYNREFLMRNDLWFPAQLKVLDDICFNFKVFGRAAKVSYLQKRLYHYCIHQGTITRRWDPGRGENDRQAFEYLRRCIADQEQGGSGKQESISSRSRRRRMLIRAYRLRVVKSALVRLKLRLLTR